MPTPITQFSTTPLSTAPATFDARMDIRIAEQERFVTETNVLAADMNLYALAGPGAASLPRSKNDIINGDFRIAQAGTSIAAPANGAYDLDGWFNGNISAAVFTVAQAAGSTAGRLARSVTITTADASVAAGDVVHDATRIEGYNIVKYVGNTFTIGFRARVPVAGIHCVSLRNSGQDRSYVKEINFPAANVWQDCLVTVVGGLPTSGTWNYTNGVGLSVSFLHMCGTTFQTTPDAWQTGNLFGTTNQVNDCATVGNVWAIEKFTMNLGTVAAVSEVSYEDEERRCKRQYRVGVIGTVGASSDANSNTSVSLGFNIEMRAAPVITNAAFIYRRAGVTDIAGATVPFDVTPTSVSFAVASGAAYVPVTIVIGSYVASARL